MRRMKGLQNNIVQFKDRYESTRKASGQLPFLFIMAKTYGASKEFVAEHQLEEKLKFKFRDIIYLYKSEQLRGVDSTQIQIVSLPRHDENKYDIVIKKMASSRGIHIVSAAKFLNLIKPDG